MPIYQYICSDCGEEFEYIIVRSDDEPSCPQCSSMNLEKQVSGFSIGKSATYKKGLEKMERSLTENAKPKTQQHVGCSKGYVKKLQKKYG